MRPKGSQDRGEMMNDTKVKWGVCVGVCVCVCVCNQDTVSEVPLTQGQGTWPSIISPQSQLVFGGPGLIRVKWMRVSVCRSDYMIQSRANK